MIKNAGNAMAMNLAQSKCHCLSSLTYDFK